MDPMNLEAYEKAVLDRICAVCIDRRDDGTCGLDPKLVCAVREHLPTLLSMLRGVSFDDIGSYVERVRRNICTICEQGGAEECDVRERVDCTLDRYLHLVIEAIEEVERLKSGDAQASAP